MGYSVLSEQAGCCRRSCLQMGAPTRGAKPKYPWGLAAGVDAVMKACLHREIREALGELPDKKQQRTEKKLPQEPQRESVGMTRHLISLLTPKKETGWCYPLRGDATKKPSPVPSPEYCVFSNQIRHHLEGRCYLFLNYDCLYSFSYGPKVFFLPLTPLYL